MRGLRCGGGDRAREVGGEMWGGEGVCCFLPPLNPTSGFALKVLKRKRQKQKERARLPPRPAAAHKSDARRAPRCAVPATAGSHYACFRVRALVCCHAARFAAHALTRRLYLRARSNVAEKRKQYEQRVEQAAASSDRFFCVCSKVSRWRVCTVRAPLQAHTADTAPRSQSYATEEKLAAHVQGRPLFENHRPANKAARPSSPPPLLDAQHDSAMLDAHLGDGGGGYYSDSDGDGDGDGEDTGGEQRPRSAMQPPAGGAESDDDCCSMLSAEDADDLAAQLEQSLGISVPQLDDARQQRTSTYNTVEQAVMAVCEARTGAHV